VPAPTSSFWRSLVLKEEKEQGCSGRYKWLLLALFEEANMVKEGKGKKTPMVLAKVVESLVLQYYEQYCDTTHSSPNWAPGRRPGFRS
jgi:hypothetical protein